MMVVRKIFHFVLQVEMLHKQIERELDVERNGIYEDYGRLVDVEKYLQEKSYYKRERINR
jgi:hypothetical protein